MPSAGERNAQHARARTAWDADRAQCGSQRVETLSARLAGRRASGEPSPSNPGLRRAGSNSVRDVLWIYEGTKIGSRGDAEARRRLRSFTRRREGAKVKGCGKSHLCG